MSITILLPPLGIAIRSLPEIVGLAKHRSTHELTISAADTR